MIRLYHSPDALEAAERIRARSTVHVHVVAWEEPVAAPEPPPAPAATPAKRPNRIGILKAAAWNACIDLRTAITTDAIHEVTGIRYKTVSQYLTEWHRCGDLDCTHTLPARGGRPVKVYRVAD